MAKAKKNYINLACSECKNRNYYVNKSKGKTGKPEKLELMKFCNHCRKHTLHIEGKKDSKKK